MTFGGGASSGNDVRFYDYDGSVVASYSAANFATLTTMPENPTHTGLTGQGWNWTLADAKAYVAAYGKLNIGQMYITSDGKTRFYYVIPKDGLTLNLSLILNNNSELDIDWGDGSAHTTWTSTDSVDTKSHTYDNTGEYTVVVTVVNGGFSPYSKDEGNYLLRRVELGDGVTILKQDAFKSCPALVSVTIPNSVTILEESAFDGCSALPIIIIPYGLTTIGNYAFEYCPALFTIVFSNSITSIGDSVFDSCTALSLITLPDSITSIGDSAFSYCAAISSISIPNSINSLGSSVFNGCYGLVSVTIPNSVTTINGSVFSYSYAISSLTFKSTVPPTLTSELELPTTCIIQVPQGSLSAYTSASNYPSPTDYIYEEY